MVIVMGVLRKFITPLSLLLLFVSLILAACGENSATITGTGEASKETPVARTFPTPVTGQAASTVTSSPLTPVQGLATVTPVSTSPVVPSNPVSPAISPAQTVSAATQAQVQKLLVNLWETYKQRYMQQDGRVRDPQRTDISTSEGESYALLRSVWQDDRQTFDAVLTWTVNNLQKPRGDKLFAYLWGKAPDNSWKVLDAHAATDADQDIALALLLASERWNEPSYLNQGLEIVNGLWDKAIVTVKGRPYLVAGDWATATPRPVLNPSYFSPYTYRLFANVDPNKNHDWNGLIDSSYEVINGCTVNSFDTGKAGKLPPHWCAID
jgi:hypothetical protein